MAYKIKNKPMKEKKYPYEILVRDKKTGNTLKLVYTDEKKYKNSLEILRKAEVEGKCEIIPQDINEYFKTGIKK